KWLNLSGYRPALDLDTCSLHPSAPRQPHAGNWKVHCDSRPGTTLLASRTGATSSRPKQGAVTTEQNRAARAAGTGGCSAGAEPEDGPKKAYLAVLATHSWQRGGNPARVH